MPATRSLDLFSRRGSAIAAHTELAWPPAERFPLNLDLHTVEDQVLRDLHGSATVLIVTGFASLDRLIDFIADHPADAPIRIVFGWEPFDSRRDSFELAGASFPEEMEHYWLGRGISLLLSAKLIHCIERLKSGKVLSRYLSGTDRLHAKIYVGDLSVTLGSSNFTNPGLRTQLEANARFSKAKESKRFDEARQIAENFWGLGRDYNDKLIALLERLLRVVKWQEALARACAELLEGDWARDYIRRAYLDDEPSLWPSQRQGIAQALYILSRHDSVLVADATGSGKTRMGVHLIRAVQDQIIRKNRMRQDIPLMVCPPTVEATWREEATGSGSAFSIYSHGALSHSKSARHELTLKSLRRAQILCVDEGHNFLNFTSKRTQHLLHNMADHTLLFTATPINKGAHDLLRIADLLGADNLAESTLEAFRKVLGARQLNRLLTEEEIRILRREIQRFTVRRTKRLLNALIDREPDAYRDHRDQKCRYPKHNPKTYALDEPNGDRDLARRIRELADQLHAVAFFEKPIELPEQLRKRGMTEERYLNGRLSSTKKIARFLIMSSLRSSRAALVEHIAGTPEARKRYALKDFRRSTPLAGILKKLDRLAGQPPKNNLSIDLPDWLSDSGKHKEACATDTEIYRQILDLTARISEIRETKKAARLVQLLARHDLVLSFDSRPITLAVIKERLMRADRKPKVIIATGDAHSERSELLECFRPGSTQKNVIGLCSDSLSEGVNLQQASAIVHLDMPSVVRIAEQRVGRVDRMDSPHKVMEAWWPDDAEEFALSTDERFIERYETVENLLGSNLPLPEELKSQVSRPISSRDLLDEYLKEQGDMEWDGIEDAFSPVRELVFGEHALVGQATYDAYRDVTARVLARVSLVRAKSPWAFFSIAAGPFGAPRWILLPGFNASPVTELRDICIGLRKRLDSEVEDLEMDTKAEQRLHTFLKRLALVERELLSQKKQRALIEMVEVLKRFMKEAAAANKHKRVEDYQRLLSALNDPGPDLQPDWDTVAARWLDLIRPVWYDRLREKRRGPLLLRDIRRDLYKLEESLGPKVTGAFARFPVMPPPDERISACIIGVA